MKKFSILFSSIFLILSLTTFNPEYFNTGLKIFEIKKIEIKNLKNLDEKKISNLILNELVGSSLLILNKDKINNILKKNKLIKSIKFKKIYPSKLQIFIQEQEVIAIINNKKGTLYLTNNGQEIKFFKNSNLEKLPNIFGKQKNFLEVYSALKELTFPISNIKSFYYFEIGRWDIILKNKKVIKLPVKDFIFSLKNYMELHNEINYDKYSIFDYRVKDQLILN